MGGEYVRVEEVFEEPGAENGDGAFGEATLRTPWLVVDNASALLESFLLTNALIK